MIIGNLPQLLYQVISQLDEGWGIRTHDGEFSNYKNFILKYDGTILEIGEDQEPYFFSNQNINKKYDYETVTPSRILSEYLNFEKDQFGILFKNLESKLIKLIVMPDKFENCVGINGYCYILARYSKDDLTVLIYKNNSSKFFILDNPVLE